MARAVGIGLQSFEKIVERKSGRKSAAGSYRELYCIPGGKGNPAGENPMLRLCL